MSIKKIKIQQYLSFRESLELEFSDGINIFIGGNATGKTTLLKTLYAALSWTRKEQKEPIPIYKYFSTNDEAKKIFERKTNPQEAHFEVMYNEFKLRYFGEGQSKWIGGDEKWKTLDVQAVFIPTTEMLSHSTGFLALNEKFRLPFDQTQIDILVNSELPITNSITVNARKCLDKIKEIIGGEISYENDTFFKKTDDGERIEFSFEAEGYRKLGLVWKLIRNGLLEKNSVLFWDEPEANINPELIPVLVDVLLELRDNGVQIFIATHNYSLVRYFDIKSKDDRGVKFINLKKEKNNITFYEADNYSDLEVSVLRDADEELLNAIIAKRNED